MKVPYSTPELAHALYELGDKKPFLNEKIDLLIDKIDKLLGDNKSTLKQLVADDNGITLIEFINSPNYKVLLEEYLKNAIKQIVLNISDDLLVSEEVALGYISLKPGLYDWEDYITINENEVKE